MIPPLEAGAYRVQVVTQFSGGGRPLDQPRTLELNKTLVVTPPPAAG